MTLIAGRQVQIAADISEVLDLTLQGSADPEFWTSHLAPEGLKPLLSKGKARIQLSAIAARFKGMRFCELNLAVLTEARDDNRFPAGAFLPCAFNSLAAFAWVERNLFHCPYSQGDISVQGRPNAEFSLSLDRSLMLRAVMAPAPLASLSDSDWEGPIYLPTAHGKPRRYFMASISGPAQGRSWGPADAWQFQADASVRALQALKSHPFTSSLRALSESGFSPDAWILRPSARHCKGRSEKL